MATELDDAPEAEILNLAYCIRAKYDFGNPGAWNGLFGEFQNSTDFENKMKGLKTGKQKKSGRIISKYNENIE